MKETLITDIQKYCIHDGDGIRTTVFFKGCPLSCRWCHNPETQNFSKQLLYDKDKCTGCGACIPSCPSNAISLLESIAITDPVLCTACGSCYEECLQNIRILSGKHYTTDALVHEIEKDFVFYEKSGGGVTLSGGEVLAQNPDYIESVLVKLNEKGIRINIDTCGHAPYSVLQRYLPYVNTFLYDIKVINSALHEDYTGIDNRIILDNLCRLSRDGARLWIRIPVIEGVNNTTADMREIAAFLKDNNIQLSQLNLLPYHNTGSNKYMKLNKVYKPEEFSTPRTDELEAYIAVFNSFGFQNVTIGG